MNEQIVRLKAEDYEELIDFLNLVFSQSGPIDFEKIHPRLYRPTDEHMRCNFAVKVDEKIRAVVGLFPMTLHAGGYALKAGGIGGVSTHSKHRNSGLMRRLMEACLAEMQSQDYHLSCLGGLRQRYGYFGYEKAGAVFHYHVTRYNVSHGLKKVSDFGISFRPINENDHELLAECKALHDAQPVYVSRPAEDFFLHLKAWTHVPWAVFTDQGEWVGYLVFNGKKSEITEILLTRPELLLKTIAAWIQRQDIYGVNIAIHPWLSTYAQALGQVCESVELDQAYNWRIFDWSPVMNALLSVKSALTGLADGCMNIGIGGYGTVRVEVLNGRVQCEKNLAAPDVEWDQATAHRVVFGPEPALYIARLPDKLAPPLASWFPLPLAWPTQDGV